MHAGLRCHIDYSPYASGSQSLNLPILKTQSACMSWSFTRAFATSSGWTYK